MKINKMAPQRGAFLFFCIFVSFVLWNCNNDDKKKVVENVVVKKPEDVNKTTLKAYREILEKRSGDSLLIYDKDTLLTLPYFKRLKGENEILFFEKGKLTPLGDSVIYFVRNARYYGLYPQDYHARKLDSILVK